jgi:hypothetical protein
VTLFLQVRQIPLPDRVHEALTHPGARPLDLDSEEFDTALDRIGEFSCDAF